VRRYGTAVGLVFAAYIAAAACRGGASPVERAPVTGSYPAPEPSADAAAPVASSEPRGPHVRFACGATTCAVPDEICCSDDDGRHECVKRGDKVPVGDAAAVAAACNPQGAKHPSLAFGAECGDSSHCGDGAICCNVGDGSNSTVCTRQPSSICANEVCESPATCKVQREATSVHCAGATCPRAQVCCVRNGKEECAADCKDGTEVTCRGPSDCAASLVCCTGQMRAASGDLHEQSFCGFNCSCVLCGVHLCASDAECSGDTRCLGTCRGIAVGDGVGCQRDADCAIDAGGGGGKCLPPAPWNARFCAPPGRTPDISGDF
jgi:hypothetical protein